MPKSQQPAWHISMESNVLSAATRGGQRLGGGRTGLRHDIAMVQPQYIRALGPTRTRQKLVGNCRSDPLLGSVLLIDGATVNDVRKTQCVRLRGAARPSVACASVTMEIRAMISSPVLGSSSLIQFAEAARSCFASAA